MTAALDSAPPGQVPSAVFVIDHEQSCVSGVRVEQSILQGTADWRTRAILEKIKTYGVHSYQVTCRVTKQTTHPRASSLFSSTSTYFTGAR